MSKKCGRPLKDCVDINRSNYRRKCESLVMKQREKHCKARENHPTHKCALKYDETNKFLYCYKPGQPVSPTSSDDSLYRAFKIAYTKLYPDRNISVKEIKTSVEHGTNVHFKYPVGVHVQKLATLYEINIKVWIDHMRDWKTYSSKKKTDDFLELKTMFDKKTKRFEYEPYKSKKRKETKLKKREVSTKKKKL